MQVLVLVCLLASTEALRPMRPGAAALAAAYQGEPAGFLHYSDESLSAARHLMKETKKPATPKSVRSMDAAARAFARMNPKPKHL